MMTHQVVVARSSNFSLFALFTFEASMAAYIVSGGIWNPSVYRERKRERERERMRMREGGRQGRKDGCRNRGERGG